MKGISSLSCVTGQEHDQMCCILIGLIIDIPLPGGMSNMRLVRAVQAVLDFLYLAQYPMHTNETLETLEDALACFHQVKDIFVDLGIRESFNIPKLHFVQHYVMLIRLYSTTDNFDTMYTKQLHIDFAKDAYNATNHKDEFTQMANWLERKEKIFRHDQYLKWAQNGSPISTPHIEWEPPGLELGRFLHMSKHPTVCAVPIDRLIKVYGATYFCAALAHLIALANEPDLMHAQLEARLCSIHVMILGPTTNFLLFSTIYSALSVTRSPLIPSRAIRTATKSPDKSPDGPPDHSAVRYHMPSFRSPQHSAASPFNLLWIASSLPRHDGLPAHDGAILRTASS